MAKCGTVLWYRRVSLFVPKNNYNGVFIILKNKMLELLRKNANRCIALVLLEIIIIGFFHRMEGELFLISEMVTLSIHLVLSLFWLCFYVMMRSKLQISKTKWFSIKRLLWDPALYIVFDFIIIHVIIWMLFGEFQLHTDELLAMLIGVYGINLYFDTHKHHCCHDHCG